MQRVLLAAALFLLAVLALATPSAASGAECTAAQIAEVGTCTGKLKAPTGTDKAEWCKYMQDYVDCIAHDNKECCEVASLESSLTALKTTNAAYLAADCDLDCGEHAGHDHGAATGVRASGFAALAIAVVAMAVAH